MIYYFILIINLYLLVQGQSYLPDVCLMTFDSASATSNPLNPNANMFVCPSSCYTERYRSNQQEYPLFGNFSYSGNSLICKAALHDGRLAPWSAENSTIFIRNSSVQSSTFISTLRNGIFSAKSNGPLYFIYQFTNNRINETSIPDIAIEHRGYLYSQDQPSSITCRSKMDLQPIEPINVDHGWKTWQENRLNYFTFPRNLTRQQSVEFCSNNNGTLMYWGNLTEEQIFQEIFSTTFFDLFHDQRNTYTTLNFFIGLKQINQIKQWESDVISYNQSLNILFNSTNQQNYCTIVQLINNQPQLMTILYHSCDDVNVYGYPLCRLLPSVINQQNDFIYRLETDDQPKNLIGVIDFCSELGGYPIYAYNAYEWQIIQEIMLQDPSFSANYVYTGLISPTKQVNDAYWVPKNISYNSSLNYLWFASDRGQDRTGFHLSKAYDESYYGLYDINPYSNLNTLRFCRKPDIQTLMTQTSTCDYRSCTSNCRNLTLPSQTDDTRFGFYGCIPNNSLAGIVYTQAFPQYGDFIRPQLPMDYSVALRRNYNESLTLYLEQINTALASVCYEYINFDTTSSLDDTKQLNCYLSNINNLTMNGIIFREDLNSLLTFSLERRRMSGHHTRYIDYQLNDSRCRYQGIYHPYVNQCICAPGFYGDECQYTCPPGYYGQTCDFYCQGDDDYCKSLLICLPDPYGCSCYTGWYGVYCNLTCPSDRYGPDCSYQCSCSNCNRFTGVCDCNGTECYEGIYSRTQLQSKCPSPSSSSSSTNLALLIVLPIISVTILIILIAVILYWKVIRQKSNTF